MPKLRHAMRWHATGLLSHAMTIGGRSPNKILLARASGRVWQIDFFPAVRSCPAGLPLLSRCLQFAEMLALLGQLIFCRYRSTGCLSHGPS